ncbi:MAG: hypothetical protein PUD50_14240, partial [Eubacteriales bacterium]|nr:hypothetical protein [Eubacteriales bacterium]
RAHSAMRLKMFAKHGDIFIAHCPRNLLYPHVAGLQQFFGTFYSQSGTIIKISPSEIHPKQFAKIRGGKTARPCHHFQRKIRTCIIFPIEKDIVLFPGMPLAQIISYVHFIFSEIPPNFERIKC